MRLFLPHVISDEVEYPGNHPFNIFRIVLVRVSMSRHVANVSPSLDLALDDVRVDVCLTEALIHLVRCKLSTFFEYPLSYPFEDKTPGIHRIRRNGISRVSLCFLEFQGFLPTFTLPGISLSMRLILPYRPLNGREYFFRSGLDILFGLPLLWIVLTFVP